MKLTPICLLALLAFNSCKDDACLKGSGKRISERKALPSSIRQLTISNNLGVDIYLDGANYVLLEGGENVLPYIDVVADDTKLNIDNLNHCYFLRNFDSDIHLSVHVENLESIVYKTSKDLILHDTIKAEYFEFESVAGSGSVVLLLDVNILKMILDNSVADVNLYGRSKSFYLFPSGSSWVFGQGMISEYTHIETRSTGDCVTHTVYRLECKLRGIGNVQYIGNPDIVIEERTGAGSVFKYSP